MKKKLVTVQLRSTIFLQQNIGYTPENATQFQKLLGIADSKVYGIPQPGAPILGVNPMTPQFGMPWRLFQKEDNGFEYNVAFQPGKIDIVLAKQAVYSEDIETAFCKKSAEWFSKILDIQTGVSVQRIAYAPLYAIEKSKDDDGSELWNKLLKKIVYDGSPAQDIDLQFVLKKQISFNGKEIQMNFLHHFFDGNLTEGNGATQVIRNVLLFQLDLNSVVERPLSLDKDGMIGFYNGIIDIKNDLIDNVDA
jgi:hypothetical protein